MPEPTTAYSETENLADDTTPATGDARDDIKAALAKMAVKRPIIEVFDKYYFGKHPFNFSSEKFTTKFADRLRKFRDNLCPTCVKAPADRLEILGFSSDKKSEVYNQSWAAWKYSEMPRLSKRVHRDAFRTGDGFVLVWADETGKARMYPENPSNCTVFYDLETGKVDRGAKLWRNGKFLYLTLYYRDRVEKYITKNPQSAGNVPTTAAAFVKRSIPGESWPLPNPIGVCPLFHFGLETSILNDVIPLNDALNKTIADLLVSSESNSLRQRWTSGLAYEINPETGKQIIPFENASQWFAAKDFEAKFGQFPEGDLKHFLDSADFFVDQVSSVSGIPKYYFKLEGGSMPSGEALRKAESRFTALIKDAQLDFGETWAQIMRFALEADSTPVKTEAIETQWSPADPMSENEKLDAGAKKKNLGVSETRILSEIGYSDADIEAMQTENADKAAAAADNFAKSFSAGKPIGGPPK